ncbi:nuclear transport factor 2 family protein [Nocardia sp. CDC160]|uniref:nuclear transport factor 2 family protein n=1 Tax=Nocardia sp. CDC160 TaxID=3112166 RepID=UPI002DB60326|nr:nuclear transport factor 2 family protein [Nocardia sp. CDC160]MEC3913165.1 nuclear transport factor 2 family protein [Nocardia sp. CDC160]
MSIDQQDTRADVNRTVVRDLYRHVAAGDLEAGFALLHDEFVSHNPRVPHDPTTGTGKQAFRDFFATPAGQALATADQEVVRLLADDDLVAVHVHLTVAGTDMAIVDLWRLRDGLVIEHWDVVQPVPNPLPHPHGMF